MKEEAFTWYLILAFKCVWICTSAENNNFAAALNYHNDPLHCTHTALTHTHTAQILPFSHFKLHEIFISAKHPRFPLHSRTDSFYLKLVPWNVEDGDTDPAMKKKGGWGGRKKTLNYYCGFSALMPSDVQCGRSIKHFVRVSRCECGSNLAGKPSRHLRCGFHLNP